MPGRSGRVYDVLVVEDDPATLDYLRMLLHIGGYQVQIARSGSQGLIAATARGFDAILMDWRLPDMDGLRVCRTLREQHGITTPILIMTADRDPALEMLVTTVAATELIHKPFDPDALLDCIAKMIARPKPRMR